MALGQVPPVPGFLSAYDDNEVFSQELRFTSSFAGPIHFTAGGFFQKTDELFVFPSSAMEPITSDLFHLYNPTTVKETAVFTEATFDLSHALSLTAGVRHFKNDVIFFSQQGGLLGDGIPYPGRQTQSGNTPKFGLQYRFDADRMAYLNAAKGYRIGGVNSFAASKCTNGLAAIGITADGAKSFVSDSLWSYEGGLKTSWLNRRLTFNVAGFYIDWKNLQQVLGLGDCGYQATINIGAAKSQGFEMETAWRPFGGLSLSLGSGYTDAYITDNGGLTGNAAAIGSRVQNVPKWTVNSGVDVDGNIGSVPGFIHMDYAYVGDSFNARNAPRIRPSYSLVNARAGVRLDKLELALFVKNLTNKAADLGDVPPMVIQLPGRPRIAINTPRTIGVEVRANFN
jgi:iron complex outermembrane receptor protein